MPKGGKSYPLPQNHHGRGKKNKSSMGDKKKGYKKGYTK